MDGIKWKISSYGFSFHCWLNLTSLSVSEKVDAGHERSSIFRLLTENNNGFEETIHGTVFNYKEEVESKEISLEDILIPAFQVIKPKTL